MPFDPELVAAQLALKRISDTDMPKLAWDAQGVGSATARRILGRSSKTRMLAGDVPQLKPYTGSSAWGLREEAYAERRKILLEGTQGTGLSLFHGVYPFVT